MTLLALLVACGGTETLSYSVPVPPTVDDPHAPPVDTGPPPVPPPPVTPAGPLDCHTYDQDEDGFDLCADCDDTDPTTYPGAPTVCFDGQDNSCGTSDEQPCPFEGLHRLGEVGAEAFGSGAPVVITDLWGNTSFIDRDSRFPNPIHSGSLDLQGPVPVVNDEVWDGAYIGAGDLTGEGVPRVFYLDRDAYRYVARAPDPASSADIFFEPLGTSCGSFGDADGDGVSDLAVQAASIGAFTLFNHLQPGTTYSEEDAAAIYTFGDSAGYMYTTYTTAEDVDGDGLVDAVWNRYQYWDKTNRDGWVGIILSPLEGTHDAYDGPFWDSYATLGHFLTSTPPTLVDIDDDGRVELLAVGGLETNSEPGLVVVPFDATGNIDADGIRMAWTDRWMSYIQLIGDVDGDGRPELNIGRAVDGYWGTSVYPMPGIAFDAEDDIASFALAEVGAIALLLPAAGDLNDDGVPEIAVNYMADGRGPFPNYVLYPGGL